MKIIHLKLYTSKLNEPKEFYSKILKLEIIDETSRSVTFRIGKSKLSFLLRDEKCNYHFAINIPSNKIEEALEWTKKRVDIQSFNDKEIVDFPNWNANSIYFYDKEMNIVEFIARKNLNIFSDKEFGESSIISISEIGIPTLDTAGLYTKINQKYGLTKFDCDINEFCAIGDENGLFIVIDYSKKKWLPNMDEASSNPFEIEFENSFGKKFRKLFLKDEFLDINIS